MNNENNGQQNPGSPGNPSPQPAKEDFNKVEVNPNNPTADNAKPKVPQQDILVDQGSATPPGKTTIDLPYAQGNTEDKTNENEKPEAIPATAHIL